MQTFFDLLISCLVVTTLVVLVNTLSNLIWLSSMDMPINISLIFQSFFQDLIGMNLRSQIPLYFLICIPLIASLVVIKILVNKALKPKILYYSLAGSLAILGLVILLPYAFDNVEPIAGSRTYMGKIFMTLSGLVGGYYFGFRQIRGLHESN
tara:strand:- start:229 stop:684 length:456 start_codon:yes stop_codon:yes gene_type:complete